MLSWRKLLLHALVLLVFLAVIYRVPYPEPAEAEDGGAALSGEDSRELWESAQSRYRDGDYEGTLEPLQRLLADYPDNPIYVKRLAEAYREMGQVHDEIEQWERYMELSPRPGAACARLGEAYTRLGDKPGIIAIYERCVDLDPTNPEFLFFLGLGHERVGNSNEAREAYARGHELFPDYPDLKLGLARLLVHSGHLNEAREICLEVLDQDPDNVDALLVLGQAYRHLGDSARAKEHLNHGLLLKETYTDFHRQLAGIAWAEGDRDALLFHCRKILEQEPGDVWARDRVAELLGGEKE